MRALVACALTLFTAFATSSAARATTVDTSSVPPIAARDKIDPWLANRFQDGTPHDVFVLIGASADLTGAYAIGSRAERGRFVYDALREEAQAQAPLVEMLREKGYDVTRFWIINAVLVKGADAPLIDELSRRPDVGRLVGNPVVDGLAGSTLPSIAPTPAPAPAAARADTLATGEASVSAERAPATRAARRRAARLARTQTKKGKDSVAPGATASSTPSSHSANAMSAADVEIQEQGGSGEASLPRRVSPQAIECGIATVHADGVWTQTGLRGDGIVVATMDTGVEWTHPALQSKYRGWDGATADHSYSWHDAIAPTAAPLDDHNHGTHCTGTMTGDDGAGNQIGVAPGAKWVGCRNMDHGNGTPATYLDCIQWGLAPYPLGGDPFVDGRPDLAPDITNNSWSCPPSEGCDAFSLEQAFENVRAAGQLTVGAAQNAGPQCSTIFSPLGIYDAVFTVGAVDCAGVLAGFSSRGPITADGSERRKPNVAAPGVSVRSSIRNNLYAPMSGTSMATPHAAGVAALLWAAKPNLRHLVGITRCYLEKSATGATLPNGVPSTCGQTTPATRPNNFWGWGQIDALAAVNFGPDTDTDGIADGCDCAPADVGSFDPPPEIAGDRFTDTNTYQWTSLAAVAGNGTTYDVVRGLISQVRATAGFADAICVANDQPNDSYADIDLPPLDDAFYYLARGQNACGTGSWGRGLADAPRTVTSCP
jgi:subtilisin family serine protease